MRKIPTARWLEVTIARTQIGEAIPAEDLAQNLPRVKHWIDLAERRAAQFWGIIAGSWTENARRLQDLEQENLALRRQNWELMRQNQDLRRVLDNTQPITRLAEGTFSA